MFAFTVFTFVFLLFLFLALFVVGAGYGEEFGTDLDGVLAARLDAVSATWCLVVPVGCVLGGVLVAHLQNKKIVCGRS